MYPWSLQANLFMGTSDFLPYTLVIANWHKHLSTGSIRALEKKKKKKINKITRWNFKGSALHWPNSIQHVFCQVYTSSRCTLDMRHLPINLYGKRRGDAHAKLTQRGATRTVNFPLKGGGRVEFPWVIVKVTLQSEFIYCLSFHHKLAMMGIRWPYRPQLDE